MTPWRRVYDERRKILLPLIVGLVANVGILLLGILPMQTGLVAAEAAEREAVAELTNARRQSSEARQMASGRENADEQLREFYGRILPPDFATARKTTNLWLQQAAEDAGLSFKTARFDTEALDGTRLSSAYATIVLEGQYADIRRFLYAVETAEEFIVIERVTLAQNDTSQFNGGGRLGVEVVVSTYFVTPASE